MKRIVALGLVCLSIAAAPARAADIEAELAQIERLAKTEYPRRPIADAIELPPLIGTPARRPT